MKLILHPQFEHLRQFVEELPQRFSKEGEVLQDRRNTIKIFHVNGLDINVKRFRVPFFFNRIIYTFFRASKASKAYLNALEVLRRGFETPHSIAYIEQYRGGLLHWSYYISLQSSFRQEMRDYYFGPLTGNEPLIKAFAQYTADLHENGICHNDYSPGNVLIGRNQEQYRFSLVDINRMKFKPMNLKEGCRNLKRMFENQELYVFLAREYARKRGFSPEECIKQTLHYNSLSLQRDRRKKRVKRFRKKLFTWLSF